MVESSTRWVARLVPAPGMDVERLLVKGLGLDVWERHGNTVLVAATEERLTELERRLLAAVERICTVEEFKRRHPSTGPTHHEEQP